MRRKTGEENIRKITRVGKTSLAITIPKEILSSLGWKEKQRVKVTKVKKGIIIRDYRSKK